MTIPPRFLDELRSRLTLSDIIGKRVRLTRAGREFKGCCPFHKEKSPSFTVNDDKQFYHCFGCGAHGDHINFVMRHDNLSFVDAVSGLAAQAGLQMPEFTPAEARRAEKARDLYTLMDEAASWMQAQLLLPANREVLEYAGKRGLSDESLKNFRIGFAPDDRQVLKKHLLQKGFTEKDMIEAGVLKASEKGGESYVFFRGRLMFPVMDRRGRVVAFGGRILPDHLRPPERSDFKPAKYINSTETPLFDKGRMVYGEGPARQAAREGKPVLVTEGYMDVVACHQAGFKGAVAPMGTALTEEQIILLWSMIPQESKIPILCFDGDEAGRRAAERACERVIPLLKAGQTVRFAFLPQGQDPDSLIKSSGALAFQKILDEALGLFDFMWLMKTAGRDLRVPEIRAGVTKALQAQIRLMPERELQSYYQQLLSEKISETFFANRQPSRFQSGYNNGYNRGAPPLPSLSLARPKKPAFADLPVRILLAALINYPQYFADVEEALSALQIELKPLEDVRQALSRALSRQPDLDAMGLRHHLHQAGLEKEIRDIACESVYVHAAFAGPLYAGDDGLQRWFGVWESVQETHSRQENRENWRQALQSGSQDAEDRLKLRAVLSVKDMQD